MVRSPEPSRCPRCANSIHGIDDGWRCDRCQWLGILRKGIDLLPDPGLANEDHVHSGEAAHQAGQMAHFDLEFDSDFEIERPSGTPSLYRFFMDEKFRRGPGRLGRLDGATALTVCGGSGMDAEALVRAGATVVSSDLSLGAAKRAIIRKQRHQLAMSVLVADAENLPFDDAVFDIVAVHDGLHHLPDPYIGLAEMARVAKRWVVVSEPARATGTRVAVAFGLALETEPAGNRVARLDPLEVSAFLDGLGFTASTVARYAMYYPHRPGRVFALLSLPVLDVLVRFSWRLADVLVGRSGQQDGRRGRTS